MKYLINILSPLIILALAACTRPANQQAASDIGSVIQPSFAGQMEEAHGKAHWESKTAISFDLQLFFRGKERLSGRILMETNFGRIKIVATDGSEMVFVDGKAYVHPSDSKYRRARFDLLTWPYFMSIPFKLSDPGAKIQLVDSLKLNDVKHQTGKLTFGDGVGDAPDDWYKLLKDPQSDLLRALVYIVTFSKSQEEAEEDPHAIVYDDYVEVEDAQIATSWNFYNWRENGLEEKIGEAKLSNISFVEVMDQMFEVKEGAKEDAR